MAESTTNDQTRTMSEEGPLAEPTAAPRRPLGLRTDLSLPAQVALLAVWPLGEQFLSFLVMFTDTALAGRIEQAGPDAIGSAGYILWLMGLMQGVVGVGSTALIARAMGAGDRDQADTALGQSMLLAVVWGAINMVIFFTFAPWAGLVTSLEDRSLELCTQYLRILAVAAPLRAVLFIGGACLRGAGDTRSPFLVMTLVNIVNVAVSITLVAAPAPVGGHGLVGVALGTVCAWVVGAAVMVVLLVSGRGRIQLRRRATRPDRPMMGRIVRVAWPNLLESGGHWLGNFLSVVIIGYLGWLGLEQQPVGTNIIAITIEGLSFLPGYALGIAAATVVGQYLGAGDVPTARRAMWICLGYCAALMGFMGMLFIVVPDVFVWMLTDEQPYVTDAPPLLRVIGIGQLGFAAYLSLAGGLRGAGDTRTTMFLTYASLFGVRLPLAWIFGVMMGWGLLGVWIAFTIELTARGLLFFARFLHGGWAKIKV